MYRSIAIPALLASLFSAGAAPAQEGGGYQARQGGWTISSGENRQCVAINRPAEQIETTPFNALRFTEGPNEGIYSIEVFYWPGAFTEGDELTLTFGNRAGISKSYAAKAISGFAALTTDPVRYSDLYNLAGGRELEVSTKKVPYKLVFETREIRPVLDRLAACLAGFL